VHSAELARLQETQKSQRSRGITQKVMSTEYDGLIGSFLDPTQEVLEGYTAVVTETQPEITNPLSEAEIRAQQKEQKRLQEEKNTFVVGDEEVVIDEITNNPDPDPGPTPVPTPEPVPEPEPTPDPEPEPAPEPEATPESAPEPVSEIEPATDPVL
jgi:outer membrane biosynthesis protein TonB